MLESKRNALGIRIKEKYLDQVKLRVRFSLDNLKLDDDMLNIPLFMADQTAQLIGMALEKQKENNSDGIFEI